MTREDITESLLKVFRNTFSDQSIQLTEQVTADDIDGWDSITHLDLIVAVEKEYSIEINGFDVMGLKNVGDLINLIERKKVQ